jgi:hypothetical protein
VVHVVVLVVVVVAAAAVVVVSDTMYAADASLCTFTGK